MSIEKTKTVIDIDHFYYTISDKKIIKSNSDIVKEKEYLNNEVVLDILLDKNNEIVLLVELKGSYFIHKLTRDLETIYFYSIKCNLIKRLFSFTNDNENNYVIVGESNVIRKGLLVMIGSDCELINSKTWDYCFRQIAEVDNYFYIISENGTKSTLFKIDKELNIEDELKYEDEYFYFDFIVKIDSKSMIVVGRILNKEKSYKIYTSVHFTISISKLKILSVMYGT